MWCVYACVRARVCIEDGRMWKKKPKKKTKVERETMELRLQLQMQMQPSLLYVLLTKHTVRLSPISFE